MRSIFEVSTDRLTCAEIEVLAPYDDLTDRQKVVLAQTARAAGQYHLRLFAQDTNNTGGATRLVAYGRNISLEIRLRDTLKAHPPLQDLSEQYRAQIAADLSMAFTDLCDMHVFAPIFFEDCENLNRALANAKHFPDLTDLTPSEEAIVETCWLETISDRPMASGQTEEAARWDEYLEFANDETCGTDRPGIRRLTHAFVGIEFDPDLEWRGRFATANPIAA